MARTNIDVIITVRDGASKPLENVSKKLRDTGKSAKDSSVDITQFNKTLFSTIAFAGLFTKAFSSLKASMDLGAPLDRMAAQYERVLGPKGDLFKAINSTTNSIIDDQVALESGLRLGQLGLVKNSEQTGNLLAKFAVAARMAGKEGSEGVKDLTDATTGINIAKLEEYGILQKSNPALMAQFAIVNKSAGVFGNAAVKMQQMALIQKLITEHTKQHMFMFKSTGELVSDLGTSFKNLKQQIGVFVSTALRPLMEKLIPLIQNLKGVLENIYKNDKQIMFLVRSVMVLGSALSGLLATLGSLKLAVKLLGFAGIGIPGLTFAILGLGSAFLGLTRNADGMLEKFRVIGAVFKGIFELVTNLDPETGMSKISKSTRDLLEKHGLLGFTKTIARVVSIIKTVLTDIYKVFNTVAKTVNNIFGGVFTKFKNMIADFTSTWTTWWTSDAISPIEKFVRGAVTILTPLLSFLTFKGLKWGFGKLTGGLFGSKGGNDGSSPTKALWVQTIGAAGGLLGGLGTQLRGIFGGILGPVLSPIITFLKSQILNVGTIFQMVRSLGIVQTFTSITQAVTSFAKNLALPVIVISTALYGFIEGILESGKEWKIFFNGIWDLSKAVFNVVGTLLSSIPYIEEFTQVIKTTATMIFDSAKWLLIDMPLKILGMIKDGWKEIGKLPGILAGWLGEGMTDMAKSLDPQSQKSSKVSETNKDRMMNLPLEFSRISPITTTEKSSRSTTSLGDTNSIPNIPSYKSTDEDIISQITTQMQNMSANKAAEMQEALQKAIESTEGDGRLISPEEYNDLIRVFKTALDSSDNLTTLVNKQKQNNVNTQMMNKY